MQQFVLSEIFSVERVKVKHNAYAAFPSPLCSGQRIVLLDGPALQFTIAGPKFSGRSADYRSGG
jgi:hypothetical protein